MVKTYVSKHDLTDMTSFITYVLFRNYVTNFTDGMNEEPFKVSYTSDETLKILENLDNELDFIMNHKIKKGYDPLLLHEIGKYILVGPEITKEPKKWCPVFMKDGKLTIDNKFFVEEWELR